MSQPTPRTLIGLVLLLAPALLLIPGLGLESVHPRALARSSVQDGTWYYRVQPGDVLSRIAERELGTLRRMPEIMKLNPGVEPKSLRAGTVLRMPPRAAEEPRAQPSPPAEAPSARRLLISLGALLALVGLVVLATGRARQSAAQSDLKA